jgi:hypothetical protein
MAIADGDGPPRRRRADKWHRALHDLVGELSTRSEKRLRLLDSWAASEYADPTGQRPDSKPTPVTQPKARWHDSS